MTDDSKAMVLLRHMAFVGLAAAIAAAIGCDDDDDRYYYPGNDAVYRGVGAECSTSDDCEEEGQVCLPFKGGYCGVQGCASDLDCPVGSACVTHIDNENYCFLLCVDKPDCNLDRHPDAESNCVSSVVFVDSDAGHKKACEPPTG